MSDNDQKPELDLVSIGSVLGGMFGPELFAAMEKAATVEETPEDIAAPGRKASYKPNAKLIGAAAEIVAHPPSRADIAFITSELVQCSFPLRDPGDVPSWTRRNGDFTLIIQPGIDPKTGRSLGLPSGEIPRVFLPWAFKEMVKTQAPEVVLHQTENDFLRAIGADPNTGRGKRGATKLVRDQLIKTAACRISFVYSQGTKQRGREDRINMEVAKASSFWWNFEHPNQGSLFESKMIFGDLLFQAVINNPVPVDFRILVALKQSLRQSSFAIDVYKWWKYRVYRMRKNRQREIYIKLQDLMAHFGSQYKRLDNFRAAFREALLNVQQICPELNFDFVGPYFVLKDGEEIQVEAAQERLALMQPFNQVNNKTRSKFVRAYPNHNVEKALAAFYEWRPKASIEAQNINALFWAFALTWTKNNPPEFQLFEG